MAARCCGCSLFNETRDCVAIGPDRRACLGRRAGAAFSVAQAERGQTPTCSAAPCATASNLDDGDFGGAPLRGSWFRDHWGSGSVATLFSYVQTQMPPDNPGGLNDTTYADILAFILQRNGYKAGDAECRRRWGRWKR